MNRPYIIGITGGSGSGKTTFIRRLKEHFNASQVCLLSQDDYYRDREEQKEDAEGIKNFDLPFSILLDDFCADILKLSEGKTVTRQEYVFNNELATPKQLEFKSAPIIIVEGLFIFHHEPIRKLLDLKIYLHAKDNLKVIRRIKRDRVERNYPLDDVLYRYENHVMPAFEQFISPYIDDADLVVNNNKKGFDASLEVLKGFILTKLNSST